MMGSVGNVRVLIDERGAVVDLVVDDHVKILLGVVAGHLLEGEFLVLRHLVWGGYEDCRNGKLLAIALLGL